MLRPRGENELGTHTWMPKHVQTMESLCVACVTCVQPPSVQRPVEGEVVPTVWT